MENGVDRHQIIEQHETLLIFFHHLHYIFSLFKTLKFVGKVIYRTMKKSSLKGGLIVWMH